MIKHKSGAQKRRSCKNAPDQETAIEVLNVAKIVQGMILKFQM